MVCLFSLWFLALFPSAPALATGTIDRSFTPRTVQITVTQIRAGDLILAGRFQVRLYGIAAPSFGTPLGSDAVQFLNTMIRNRQISCRLTGEGFKDAEVGTCHLAGRDIAEELVREGLALPCPRLGGHLYQNAAKRAKDTGIKHRFTLPGYCGGFRGSEM